MIDLIDVVWLLIVFPLLCTVSIFACVVAHNRAQEWYYQRYGTVATVDDNVIVLLRKQVDSLNDDIELIKSVDYIKHHIEKEIDNDTNRSSE